MEEKIVEYLRLEYHPQAILLAGSRAVGKEGEKSDWDIYMLTPEKHRGGFFEWEGELLDITFKDLPQEKDGVLTGPYKPLWPVRTLFDGTVGALDKILENTKGKYDLGPLKAYPDGCQDRLRKLQRGQSKIEKHQNNPDIQFYYLTYNYFFLVQSWFEQQNLWPQPPAEALPYIKELDSEFWGLLHEISEAKGKELSSLVKKAVERIKKFQ